MSKTSSYDVVYYFFPARNEWRAADPSCPKSLGGHGGDVAALVASLERAGYHAVPGRLSIGAPEGAPRGCRARCCSWRGEEVT